MSKVKEYIGQFDEFVKSAYSGNTVNAYHRDVFDYMNFLIDYLGKDEPEMAELDRLSVRHYIASLHRAGNSSATIHRHIASLANFFEFLRRRGAVEKNPVRGLARPKLKMGLPPFVGEKELGEIMDRLPRSTPLEKRNRAVFEVFYGAGLRLSELIELKLQDLGSDGFIRVLGKRSKERLSPLGDRAMQAVREYLAVRDEIMHGKSSVYLFVSSRGNHLERRFVQRMVKDALESLSGELSPHDLRHAFATHMMRRGADMRAIQELLGHTALTATQIYTHLCPNDLKDIYGKAHPRA